MMPTVSNEPNPFAGGEANKPVRESLQHQPITARVPDRVVRGVYSTGQLVLDGPKEFVIDFLQGLTRPFQITARVVVTPQTMSEFAGALQMSLDNYTRSFGPPPALPPLPANERRPTVQEIYENYKISDDMLAGSYANQVLIGHSPTEFFLDFISGFYPTPAVSARVYLPASHAPRLLTTLKSCLEQYRQRYMNPPDQPKT